MGSDTPEPTEPHSCRRAVGPFVGHTSPTERGNLEPHFRSPGLRCCSWHSHCVDVPPCFAREILFSELCAPPAAYPIPAAQSSTHTAHSCSHTGVLHTSSSAVHHPHLGCSQPQGSAHICAVLGALCCTLMLQVVAVCCCGSTGLGCAGSRRQPGCTEPSCSLGHQSAMEICLQPSFQGYPTLQA